MSRSRMRAAVWVGIGACFALSSRAHADMISIAAFKDNTLIGDPLGALSNGGNLGIFAGRVGSTGLNRVRRAILAFDFSAIPSGSTITSVQLRLRLTQASSGSGPRTMTVHELLGDWGEGTASDLTLGGGGGAAANPGDATWLDQFKGSDPWTTPGGDFVSAPSASLSIPPASSFYTFASTSDLVADVQGWVNSPATNFGWLIRGDESVARTARRFTSRNSPVAGDRPTVIIEFTPRSERLPGDVDDDGDVDRADLVEMTLHFGQSSDATADEGDFTGDGKVGLADLAVIQSNFGQMKPTPAGGHPSVPEPAAWTMALPLFVILTAARRGRRILSPIALALIALFLGRTPAQAETALLAPVKDNSIFSERPGNSNARGGSLFVGHIAPEEEGGGIRRSLIAFDPLAAGIPLGATIQSVSPTFFFEQSGAGFRPGKTVSLHRVTADWGEGELSGGGGQGSAAQTGDATWTDRFFEEASWTTPGGDFAAMASASLFVPNDDFEDLNSFHTWPSTAELVADVQSWVDSPFCNFGWIMIGDEVGNRTAARFTSRDNQFSPENRPALAIEYGPPAPRLDGDIDFDGDVDRDDAARLVANFGLGPCVTMNDGDFTFDGTVGLADLLLLQSNIGRTLPPPGGAAAVTEPRGYILGTMALAMIWIARRRRFR